MRTNGTVKLSKGEVITVGGANAIRCVTGAVWGTGERSGDILIGPGDRISPLGKKKHARLIIQAMTGAVIEIIPDIG